LKTYITTGLIFLLVVMSAEAQESTGLLRLKQEIKALETNLRSKENQEKSIMERMEDINHKIGLRRRFIYKLEKEQATTVKNIKKIEISLRETSKKYKDRRILISRRFVSMYKKGRQSNWKTILSLSTMNQVMVWMKYQKIIIENDKRNIRLLKTQQESITVQRDLLQKERTKRKKLLNEAAFEQNILKKDKSKEKQLLASVLQTEKSLNDQIKQKQKAYRRIKKLISSSEKNRSRANYREMNTEFAKLKGKMPWPINGELVSRYGKYRSNEFKLTEENIGIEIKAAESALAESVCKGRVQAIEWQRGLGNIVLIDHGKGYYSVYGRLNVVLINLDEDVNSGTVIGQVGTKGSLHGTKLHFQIWKGKTALNPSLWLKKK